MTNWEQLLEAYWEGQVEPAELELALTRETTPEGRVGLQSALDMAHGLSSLLSTLGPSPADLEALGARLDALPAPSPPGWLATELGLPAPEELSESAAASAFFAGDATMAELEQAAASASDQEAGELELASQLGRQLHDLLGNLPAPRPFDPDADPRTPAPTPPADDATPERVRRLARLLRGERSDELVDEPRQRLHLEASLLRRAPLETLIRRALADALASCRASEATLWLLSADGQRLQGVFNQVWDGKRRSELEQAEVPVAVSAIGKVILEGRARRLGPTAYQDPVVSWTSGVEVHGMLAAPLRLGDGVVGVLSAVNPQGRELFSAEDLVALVWQAHVLGLVLADCLTPAALDRNPWDEGAV